MIPSKECPFISQYEEEDKPDLFCIGCINLIRSPEYDKGTNAEIAFICKKRLYDSEYILYRNRASYALGVIKND